MKFVLQLFGCLFCIIVGIAACSLKTSNFFSKKTEREKYEATILKDSGKNNAVVNAWVKGGKYALVHPLAVPNNFIETGKFLMNDTSATAYMVSVKLGQKLSVLITDVDTTGLQWYVDFWEAAEPSLQQSPVFFSSIENPTIGAEYFAKTDKTIIIRVQQALPSTGLYKLEIKTGPAFYFPIEPAVKSNIGSLWGAGRDAGARRHEGIDIFAPKKSKAVAVAAGTISSVSENILGGKVVFLRPSGTNYNVYYAHLDSQLVSTGQVVSKGDPIGLVGNTGNAKTTPAHLHFGVYAAEGPIDPLLFVKPTMQLKPQKIIFPAATQFSTTKATKLFTDISSTGVFTLLSKNTPLTLAAAGAEYYRMKMADGKQGFVKKQDVKPSA